MRTALIAIRLALVGIALPLAAQQPPAGKALPVPVQGWDVTEIGPGYYTFRYTGTRNVFLITNAGVIVTDPIEPAAARILREEIRKLTPVPVRYVVYSHQHWDHILGGRLFKDEGAEFVAHANCVPHFRDLPHPDLVLPDRTFSGERFDLRLGERTLTPRHLGTNHGDCLIVMTPDHVNVPFIVDLATPGGMPLPMIPDYSLHNWVRSLRELESWDFDRYVGGHGVPLADKWRLGERREYIEALMAETKRERTPAHRSSRSPRSSPAGCGRASSTCAASTPSSRTTCGARWRIGAWAGDAAAAHAPRCQPCWLISL